MVRGARIGVWREGTFGSSPETDAVMERTIKRLRGLGATIVDPANIPIEPAYDPENTALQYEFKHDIAKYLRAYTAPRYPTRLADPIAFNRAHRSQEMRFFGQEAFLAAQATSGSLTDPAYVKARRDATTTARRAVNDTLRKHDLDAVIAPTNSPAWTTDLVNGDHFLLGSSSPSAISGFPNITVPAGYASGLPVGASFIGAKWGEPRLLSLAY